MLGGGRERGNKGGNEGTREGGRDGENGTGYLASPCYLRHRYLQVLVRLSAQELSLLCCFLLKFHLDSMGW